MIQLICSEKDGPWVISRLSAKINLFAQTDTLGDGLSKQTSYVASFSGLPVYLTEMIGVSWTSAVENYHCRH